MILARLYSEGVQENNNTISGENQQQQQHLCPFFVGIFEFKIGFLYFSVRNKGFCLFKIELAVAVESWDLILNKCTFKIQTLPVGQRINEFHRNSRLNPVKQDIH